MTSESAWADALHKVCGERDALKAELAEYQWQPIETAPKDKEAEIILLSDSYAYSPCFWISGGEISENGFWAWMQSDPVYFVEIKSPTHWIPKPKET